MRLPVRFYDEIVAHATEGQPNEVCGLIAGCDGRAVKLWRTTNSDPNPRTRYNVEPLELLNILREIESRGWTLLSIYHSHPATSAYPSATDIGLAFYPEAVYIIASLSERPRAAPGHAWKARLPAMFAGPAWAATLVALLLRGSGSRATSRSLVTRSSYRSRNWIGSFVTGPAGIIALGVLDIVLALLMKLASSEGPVVRGFKIVSGKVVPEPLVLDHDAAAAVTIERQQVSERNPYK